MWQLIPRQKQVATFDYSRHVHLPEKLVVKKEKINLLYCELGGFGM
jgi:hypothetical protein